VAQWLRFWTVNHDTMGSNPAEKDFLLLTYLLTPQTFNTVLFPKCVAKVATIVDRIGTLDFRFDV